MHSANTKAASSHTKALIAYRQKSREDVVPITDQEVDHNAPPRAGEQDHPPMHLNVKSQGISKREPIR